MDIVQEDLHHRIVECHHDELGCIRHRNVARYVGGRALAVVSHITDCCSAEGAVVAGAVFVHGLAECALAEDVG